MKIVFIILIILLPPPMIASDDSQLFRGNIIAARGKSYTEIVSFLENRELFLFRTNDNSHEVIKIVHRYYGNSTFSDAWLSKLPIIQIKVQRDVNCDENIESFIDKNNTVLNRVNDESGFLGDGVEISEMEWEQPLHYFTQGKAKDIGSGYHLKCYVLSANDYEVHVRVRDPLKAAE